MATNAENAQLLSPDAEIILFELTTMNGATIFFKNGPSMSYLGDEYMGVPLSLGAEKRQVESESERPTLTIGDNNVDLGILKSTLFSGEVDGASLYKYTVELEDVLNNVDNKISTHYSVIQVDSYGRTKISLILGRFSPSRQTTIPYRKYQRPAFPYVRMN